MKTDSELKVMARAYTRDEARKAQGVTLNAEERKIRDRLKKYHELKKFTELVRYLMYKEDQERETQ